MWKGRRPLRLLLELIRLSPSFSDCVFEVVQQVIASCILEVKSVGGFFLQMFLLDRNVGKNIKHKVFPACSNIYLVSTDIKYFFSYRLPCNSHETFMWAVGISFGLTEKAVLCH